MSIANSGSVGRGKAAKQSKKHLSSYYEDNTVWVLAYHTTRGGSEIEIIDDLGTFGSEKRAKAALKTLVKRDWTQPVVVPLRLDT